MMSYDIIKTGSESFHEAPYSFLCYKSDTCATRKVIESVILSVAVVAHCIYLFLLTSLQNKII